MAFVSCVPLTTATATSFNTCNITQNCRRSRTALNRSSFIGGFGTCTKQAQKEHHNTISMTLNKVVVAGGTGFIGSRLVKQLASEGTSVTILTRSATSKPHPLEVTLQTWSPSSDEESSLFDVLSNADLVVNLAGTPIVSRWSDEGKANILSSRVDTTSLIARSIAAMPEETRPKCVVCASAVGFYGSWPYLRGAPEVDEANEAGGEADFLVDVCRQWEAAGEPARNATRWVTLRFGVVIAPGGGAMASMLPPFQLGLGGPVGSGQQAMSFIHADDLVKMIIDTGNDDTINGVYNGTAPTPTTMTEMSTSLAKALGKPCFFPVPAFVLKLLYGDGARVVLEGQRVIPTKWLARGFQFKYPTIDDTMKAVAEEIST